MVSKVRIQSCDLILSIPRKFVLIPRFFRKTALGRRTTSLAIVVFPDEGAVFQAYRLLHYHGISPEHLAIVGHGYSSPDRVGLMNPWRIIVRNALIYAVVASVVGVIVSLGVIWVMKLHQDIAVILLGWVMVSSLVGAIAGGIFGLVGEGTTASVYRHHLREGRYLLMMEGSENLVRWGQEVLSYYSTPSLH